MTGTTKFAVRRAVADLLAEDATLEGVPVHYGEPGDLGRRTHVWVGATAESEQAIRAMAGMPSKREEDYTFPVVLEVIGEPTTRENEERAETLCQAIETLIAADALANSCETGLLWVMVAGIDVDTTEHVDGPRTVVEITVAAKARIG